MSRRGVGGRDPERLTPGLSGPSGRHQQAVGERYLTVRGLSRDGLIRERRSVSSVSTVAGKVEVRLRWDPSPWGQQPRHLDIVAATYSADAPHGRPVYVVNSESRSPDGTINMSRRQRERPGVRVHGGDGPRTRPSRRVVRAGGRRGGDPPERRGQDVRRAVARQDAGRGGVQGAAVRRLHGGGRIHRRDGRGVHQGRLRRLGVPPDGAGFDSEPAGFSAEMGSASRP